MPPPADLPVLAFPSAAKWEQWLKRHQKDPNGLWLKLAKSGSGLPTVTYAEAVEVALCYGWIDGQKAPLDATHWLQRFCPRRKRSKWSKINCGKVQSLIEQGRMQPEGLREIEAAQADGRWAAAYEPASQAQIPPDLQAELDRSPKAAAFYATLNAANRYAILYRLHDAKKPETRARRLAQFVTMLEEGRKLH